MPVYRIEVLEQATMGAVYAVEAASAEEAEKKCRSGEGCIEEITIQDSRWIELVAVEEL